MTKPQNKIRILFVLFAVINSLYLHRVPGLMGDEASEGENVYELLDRAERGKVTVMGERSYIGPVIDYIRVPFVLIFGYSASALRLVMWLASLGFFWLVVWLFSRWWGKEAGLVAAVMMLFSPIYLSYQRIGWAITLTPLFGFLIYYLLEKKKWLFAGLVAGLGLANHILFLPVLVAVLIGWVGAQTPHLVSRRGVPVTKGSKALLILLIGFWAGFGMQFVMLVQDAAGEQGNPAEVAASFNERVDAFKQAWSLYVSGSSYIARYTGVEMSGAWQSGISWILVALSLVGVIGFAWREKSWRRVGPAWFLLMVLLQLVLMLYFIDRFTLRYFVPFTLGVWVSAGLGVVHLIGMLSQVPTFSLYKEKVFGVAELLLAFGLAGWFVFSVIVPFLRTGGSLEDFSLGNRTNSAEALVDHRELIGCLSGVENAYSENVHIWNRLQFLSHQYDELDIVEIEDPDGIAEVKVHYRMDCPVLPEDELCPSLQKFCVSTHIPTR